ncbi:uncharacterized protein LOC142255713 [Anomaloglossus baeobatrachus]|uniref:uncharacterized protein LOC142255713 n=1 Tax=Anomaloglossus baeobatrachus TaxID=238106 RepID=UPI003F4F3FB0
MYLWVLLCVIAAFAATGDCLQCISCSIENSDSCSSTNTESCLVGQVCASQSTLSIKNGEISQKFKRFCAPQSECNVNGSFTYYNTSERIATTCCFNDSCSSEKPKVPSTTLLSNGIICSKCSLAGPACGADQNMNCTGNETMCLLMSTKYILGTQTTLSLVRGCASRGYCIKSNTSHPSAEGYTEITYQCTSGSLANSTTPSTVGSSTATTPKKSGGTCRCSVSLLLFFCLFILLM